MSALRANAPLVVCLVGLAWTASLVTAEDKPVEFDRDIAPILEERCWHCHGEDEQESGLRLDQRASMLRGGDSGLATVVPGKPEKSYLIEVIRHVDEDMAMPPDDDKMPDDEISLVASWIKQGAVWPGQMEAVEEERSEHWSFQPVVRPEVPSSDKSNPVDAFLSAKLKQSGLSYSSSADARSLIRRLSIVLTGLPPTPEEADAFASAFGEDPDAAYNALVDRLLDSPHFGERWAQHWLDVIRWAETNGSESNMYRKNAWIYRDYVIRSFNEDKPYNRFLFEQIAGDTVGQGDATGYLVSGPHVPVATVGQEPSARRQARADRMDEILQTVGASALGMTIGCARCHNHKFDPISIQDYYSMSAVFQDIEFGSRMPELSDDHPRRMRGKELSADIRGKRDELREFGPWEENWTGYKEIFFPARKTDAVRVTFLRKQARVDEMEIFGPEDWRENLAAADLGTVASSPESMAVLRAETWKINDREYGTEAWAGKMNKEGEQPWVQLTFAEPKQVNRVRMSTNRGDFLRTDYLLGMNFVNLDPYRIEIRNEAGEFVPVAGTGWIQQLNKKNPERVKLERTLNGLIEQINEEGPKPSFVAHFIKPAKTHVFARGSPENPRDEVFAAGPKQFDGDLELPPNAPGKERRAAFANWLIRGEHPLTARVAVNRIWHHLFGQGIVTTTGDFGAAGAPPTHPELLDWLAAEFIEPSGGGNAWSVKQMIRLLVTSEAFRQSSLPREDALAIDAGTALLWRFPPKRVEAEVIRDAILQASGSLDSSIGGRSFRIHNVKKRYAQWIVENNHGADTWRRMIYQERMRRVDDQMFTAFDFPDCGQVRAKRPVSTTPLQALNLMNSDFVIEQAGLIAERAEKNTDDLEAATRNAFRLLLSRDPDAEELKDCVALARESGLDLLCRTLINTNEFAFLP